MAFFGFTLSRTLATNGHAPQNCQALGDAMTARDIGQTVVAVQKLILTYYENVRGQAERSFMAALIVALFGFILLTGTVVYGLRTQADWHVSAVGLIGGTIVEFIAGVQFVLYGRATRQFGAFHICLERTHRYLLAYKMAEQMTAKRDETLEKIVCIMANAPMITREDIDGVESGDLVRRKRVSAKSHLNRTLEASGGAL
jgi:hypothetical protein